MEISFSSVHYIPQLKATAYEFLAAKCKNMVISPFFEGLARRSRLQKIELPNFKCYASNLKLGGG